MNLFGSMPCALAIRNGIAYICNGGDNAICEMVLSTGTVRGFRPAGFYPVAIALSRKDSYAFILNAKGNGSVLNTSKGRAGNVRDFQGTVSIIDLASDLKMATKRVAANNGWDRDRKTLHPNLAVFQGAIRHVLYIIKENRTYDEIFGDMPQVLDPDIELHPDDQGFAARIGNDFDLIEIPGACRQGSESEYD